MLMNWSSLLFAWTLFELASSMSSWDDIWQRWYEMETKLHLGQVIGRNHAQRV